MKNRLRGCASVGLVFGASVFAILDFSGSVSAQTGQAQETMTIASFGGKLDEAFKKAARPFEEKRNILIKWVPGTSAENAAKVVGTKNAPEYDAVLLENVTQNQASRGGALAEVDESIVTNYKKLMPQATRPSRDAIGVGFYVMGLFYDVNEFQKRGWTPPASWNDLLRPEFCKVVGLMHPNVSNGLQTIMMFGGGPEKIDVGIKKLGELKNCIPTLEPSTSKFDEKVQLKEYLVGAHSTIRALPLIQAKYPIKLVLPRDGTIVTFSAISVVKNAPKARLAQELANWLIGPDAQQILMREAFYSPSNRTVDVPADLKEMGVPTREDISKAIVLDDQDVVDKRRGWVRQIDRELAR
jgi:putative spermidine/putrescine transport system substrate-binding protein